MAAIELRQKCNPSALLDVLGVAREDLLEDLHLLAADAFDYEPHVLQSNSAY